MPKLLRNSQRTKSNEYPQPAASTRIILKPFKSLDICPTPCVCVCVQLLGQPVSCWFHSFPTQMDFDCLPGPALRPSLSMMVGTCLPFVCTLVWQPPLNDFLCSPLCLSPPLALTQCSPHGCWLLAVALGAIRFYCNDFYCHTEFSHCSYCCCLVCCCSLQLPIVVVDVVVVGSW